MSSRESNEFQKASASPVEPSFLTEVAAFLKANRKWWLVPIFASLLAMGAILALSGTAAAPFIYSLF